MPSVMAPAPDHRGALILEASRLARGLAVLRIFVGSIFLLNGLAKVFGWSAVNIGPYGSNLIDRGAVGFILDFEVNRNPAGGSPGTELPLLGSLVNDLILPNIDVFAWLITVVEVVVGLLLVLGLASRGAALVALGQSLFLALVYFSSNRWLFEQPLDYVPAAILTFVPTGRVWGLDGRLSLARARAGAWPF
jgi:uncharacterized membrane protein YphA (DoxX/SURF4 family)